MTDFAAARRMMVDGQVRTADVTDLRLLAAMLELPRERFFPADKATLAYLDLDVPVSEPGQPIRRLLKPMVLAKLIQAADIDETERVLDVGCGTGYWTQFYAPLAQQVTGVDVNRETLEVAVEKNWPEERVEFRIADAYALPDDLGEFGAAFAGFWWSHIPVRERPRFYASLHRRLRAGAIVVLLDNLYVEGSNTPISRRDAEGNTYQQRRLADGSEHEVLKNFPTEEILEADVASSARNARYTALDYYWVFRYEFAG
jgi:protein-L-isoaspartate O-methyltransferase